MPRRIGNHWLRAACPECCVGQGHLQPPAPETLRSSSCAFRCWKREFKMRTALGALCCRNPAAVRIDDGAADRQPESGTPGTTLITATLNLRKKELRISRRETRAVV